LVEAVFDSVREGRVFQSDVPAAGALSA